MSAPKFNLTDESVTIIVDGKPSTFKKGTPNYAGLVGVIAKQEYHRFGEFLTVESAIAGWMDDGDFTDVNGKLHYKGEPVPQALSDRMASMASRSESPKPLMRFYERLQRNPSFRSVQQLYPFLAHKGIPIEEDGCFLAYKSVKSNLTDHHTGTVSNKPGNVLEMPRNKISDDPDVACHYGYHVGALAYAKSFGSSPSKIVICRIDPEHVVCIPKDSRQQKMRVCKYEVVGHHTGQVMPSTTVKKGDVPEKGAKSLGDKAPKSKATGKRKGSTGKAKVDPAQYPKMDTQGKDELKTLPLDTLRGYAANHLKIVGASKIPGGKLALISKILDVRG
jgi:hypothetical protein